MTRYIALLCKDADSSYGLHFPDLPGCTAAGETEEEAFANGAVALRLWAEDSATLPEPSSMAGLRTRSDVREDILAGAVAVYVPIITSGRKQRLNIMLEPSIVEATDLAAKAAGVSRSEFIERSLEDRLTREAGAARIATRGRSRRRSPEAA